MIDKPQRAGGAPRRRQLDRHPGQCADRPLRRKPFGHRRRAAARHRAPSRQGHDRPHGGGQDRPGPSPLAAQFADHGRTGPIKRGYLAFVWGAPDRPKGTIDQPIGRHPHARDKMAVREGGRAAVTHWEIAGTLSGYQTGRRSQASWPAGSIPAGPTRSGSTWPRSATRCSAIRSMAGFPDQDGPFAAGRPRGAGSPWKTGPACLSTGGRTPITGDECWSSARNYRQTLRVYDRVSVQRIGGLRKHRQVNGLAKAGGGSR